ncbi:hypothetical protein BJY01DRAFT_222025 [Aspergillus pseudoustus]|uniref:EthD domain-containing protein n=1 Tax=Aspergillus pseudoustus TaxID=1810923 RepID=A0ABR4JA29_9EURO
MPAFLTLLYPNDPDAKFNLDYYVKSHMPMVEKEFRTHGLRGWQVSRFLSTVSGEPAPYAIQASLEFGTQEELENALKSVRLAWR